MNTNDLINELLSELSYRSKEGYPDFTKREHISILSEILDEWGLSHIKSMLIRNLLNEDEKQPFKTPVLNKVIKYKNVSGEEAEGRVGDLIRRPEEEDAHQRAKAELDRVGDEQKQTANDELGTQGQKGRDLDKEREKSDKSDTQTAQDEPDSDIGSALSSDTQGGTDYLKNLPDGDPAKPEEFKKDDTSVDTKIYSTHTIKQQTEKLNGIDKFVANADDDTKKRADILKDNWKRYITAKSKEEKIKALRELAEYNLIEAHSGKKKIYLSSNTSIPYKHLTGSSGNSITMEMNELIDSAGIDLPVRGGSKDRALADMSGKHNEAGVTMYLFPSDENKKLYENTQIKLKDLGGDESKFDKINKKAADAIKSQLPDGVEIIDARQVGGIGKNALLQLGIDPKDDPTDLIVKYKDKGGVENILKVSAKTYSDPKNITMKNAGTSTAGKTYLGDIGEDIDSQVQGWRDEFAWNDLMSDEDRANQKRKLKQTYLKAFGDKMIELSKTDKGSTQLVKMWKDVHGCGKDVYTQIINKNTGEVDIKSPDYYCDPKPPFDVKYDGVKLIITMEGQDNKYLQIDMKTENKDAPKLLFRHRSK